MNNRTIHLGQWRINSNNNTLVFGDEERKLENKPMQLLLFLVGKAGSDISKNEIIDSVWHGRVVTDDVLSVAISQLRKALSDNARNPEFIKTIPGFGYCLIGSVSIDNHEERRPVIKGNSVTETLAAEIDVKDYRFKTKQKFKYDLWVIIILLMFILLAKSNWRELFSEPVKVVTKEKVLAILPINNYSEQKTHQYFSDSLTEILISEFAKRSNWRVISHTSVEKFKDTEKSLPEIAKALGADIIMEGSLIVADDVAISLQLIDGKTDHHYWAERFHYQQQPSYSEQETIAQRSIHAISKIFPVGMKVQKRGATQISNKTSQLYEKSRQLLVSTNKKDWRQALSLLEEAAVISPEYAPFYVLMAQAKAKILAVEYGQFEQQIPEFRMLLLKALELDPQLASAHNKLALVYFLNDWQFDKAELHFKKAISFNANNSSIRYGYMSFLLTMKRFDEAMQQVEVIRQIDPLTYSIPMIAWVFNMQKKYDLALQETNKLLTLNPDKYSYQWSAQSISENLGNFKQSTLHMLQLLDTFDYTELEREQIQQAAREIGLSGIYTWLLDVKKETRNIGQYKPPMSFARYALSSGNNDLALDYLEQALAEKQNEILWISVDPKYDMLRDEPRFKEILVKLGL